MQVAGKGLVNIDPGSVTATPGVPSQEDPPANPTSPNALYVEAVYEDVLGRAAEPAGLAYWTRLLDSGTSPTAVAAAINHSDEYYDDFVIAPGGRRSRRRRNYRPRPVCDRTGGNGPGNGPVGNNFGGMQSASNVGEWYWLVSNDGKDAGGANPAGAFDIPSQPPAIN